MQKLFQNNKIIAILIVKYKNIAIVITLDHSIEILIALQYFPVLLELPLNVSPSTAKCTRNVSRNNSCEVWMTMETENDRDYLFLLLR